MFLFEWKLHLGIIQIVVSFAEEVVSHLWPAAVFAPVCLERNLVVIGSLTGLL